MAGRIGIARAVVAAALAALAAGPAPAQQAGPAAAPWVADGVPGSFAHGYAERLYHVSLDAAEAHARAALGAEGQTARLALGTALFLRAVEGLTADLVRFGLVSRPMLGLPFLRLPVPPNTAPERLDYAAFRAMLIRFVGALARAEAELVQVTDPGAVLPLRPTLARIDANGDGAHDGHERLSAIFAVVTGRGMMGPAAWDELGAETGALMAALAAGDPAARAELDGFAPAWGVDGADAAWLAGYCHLLSAMVEILLAHDWEASFNQSFHAFFPDAGLPMARLNDIFRIGGQGEASWQNDPQLGLFADLAAFAVHSPWAVAEPDRLRAARAHLLAMIGQSRRSWAMIRAETDSPAAAGLPEFPEWIPAPAQAQGQGMQVTGGVVAGWLGFLDAFEGMLEGRLLIPHWRFAQGMNLRRMFEEPRPLSPILLVQGGDAIPYLEHGPLADSAYLEEILDLLGGDFIGYAIWFN